MPDKDYVTKNKELILKEIKEGKTILKSKPSRLIVTLTTMCNVSCTMCEVRTFDWDLPETVADEIAELFPYLESIAWQGGEVFYYKHFEKLFNRVLEYKNLRQTIVSNGLLIKGKWIDKIVRSNMGLAISIDGVTKGLYESIRKGSDFKLLMNNIGQLNKARRSNKSDLDLRLHTVVMRSNYKELVKFIDFAKKNEFNAVHFMPIYGERMCEENLFIKPEKSVLEEVKKLLGKARKKSLEYGVELLSALPIDENSSDESGEDDNQNGKSENCEDSAESSFSEKSEDLLCYLPWQQLNVDPGGFVRPGCICSQYIGNVLDNKLIDIWNSEQMQKYRESIVKKEKKWCSKDCLDGNVPIELRRIF